MRKNYGKGADRQQRRSERPSDVDFDMALHEVYRRANPGRMSDDKPKTKVTLPRVRFLEGDKPNSKG